MSITQVDNHIVTVRILGKHYNIKCPPEQAEELQKAANVIEERLNTMKRASGTSSTDRMLVVTALNLCHELMTLKNERANLTNTVDDKLRHLQSRISAFLTAEEELAVC